VRDVLADAESRVLVEKLYDTRGAELAGALSVLYAGDLVVALQLGLRSRDVWHCWIPAYNRELHRHSPGLMLLLELARVAAERGIREIDLGKGEAHYKATLATGAVEVLEGCVGARPLAVFPVRARASALRAIRRVGVHRAVRRALHRLPR
jgi:CelD/BcsL family acetyltransferase involved in cellulose biosynthesis